MSVLGVALIVTGTVLTARPGGSAPSSVATASLAVAPGSPSGAVEDLRARATSDIVLREVAAREHVAGDDARADRAASWWRFLPERWALFLPSSRDEGAPDPVAALKRQVAATPSLDGSRVDIAVSDADAARATRLAEALAVETLADADRARADPVGAIEPATPPRDTDAMARSQTEAALEAARAKVADAKARADAIERQAHAGRYLDPAPDGLPAATLEGLRTQYVGLLQQEAAQKTTLGDRHPVLVETEQRLRDMRRALAGEQGRLVGVASRALDSARADAADAERQARLWADLDANARANRTTGGDPPETAARVEPAARLIGPASVALRPAPGEASAGTIVAALVAVGSIALAGFAAFRRTGPTSAGAGSVRRSRRAPDRGRAATPVAAERTEPSASDPVPPIIARLPVPADLSPAAALSAFVANPFAPFPAALQGLYATLRTAVGFTAPAAPWTVYVAGAGADATVAVGLAYAAARAGERTLILEAGETGTLSSVLVPGWAAPRFGLFGGRRRAFYSLDAEHGDLCLMPARSEEARALRRAEANPRTAWLDGSAAFDAVVMFGAGSAEAACLLAGSADVVLLVARGDTTPEVLAGLVGDLGLDPSKPCAAVLADAPATAAGAVTPDRVAPDGRSVTTTPRATFKRAA